MNKIILFVVSLVILVACQQTETNEDTLESSKAQVKVTSIRKGILPDYLSVTGKTVYYNKNTIVAPINGYVTKVLTEQGDHIKKGNLLFEMQTKEAFAMQKNDSLAKQYGIIKITAPDNGFITTLNVVKQGVYIDQGSAMCTIIGANNLKIIAEVPFEYGQYAKVGKHCKIVLPDNTHIDAIFTKALPQMNEISQTMQLQANINTNLFIPEKMIVKILIDKNTSKTTTQILPKSCIMTDALMSKFWVMKILNDSTAIEVPVETGTQTHDSTEICSPIFNDTDLFINEGAYGLEDTVSIKILTD
jgi:Tfp pilus assembly protein PilP